jgi:hypothetical protein
MANTKRIASTPDTVALDERIRQLGGAASFLRKAGHIDLAREVEHERTRLRRQRGPAPVEVEVSVVETIDLLAAVLEAVTVPPTTAGASATYEQLIVQRAEWVKTTLEPVLKGVHDFPFATSFLRAQTRRLQPEGEGE